MKYEALRKEITTACQEMNRRGIAYDNTFFDPSRVLG